MRLADRLDDLGTETAFAVAAAAADWKARGNEVYPFHLGDLDFPLADHIVEAMNAAIADGQGLSDKQVTRLHAHRWDRNWYTPAE